MLRRQKREKKKESAPRGDNGGSADFSRKIDAQAIKDFYRYIWKVSARSQVILSVLAIVVFLLELVPLELQRRIVNAGVHQKEYQLILWLCLAYVAVALVHGGIKLALNIYRGSVSESANRRLRLQLDPAAGPDSSERQRTAAGGVKISIIVSEVEAVGGFVGTSFSEPLLNAGVLLSVLGYMVVLQPWMALIAFLMFGPQLLFIPYFQTAINRSTQRRIETLRELSVAIVDEEANGARPGTHGTVRRRIHDVYRLNMQIFVRKFGIGFLMNLCYTLGVIGILAVGTWFVLQGRTEVGTIVAFISGLGRMNDPWRDLVNYMRDLTNTGLKYKLIAAELAQPEGAGD